MDISRAFQTSSETVAYFFTQGGTAYYIPLYQREYSWDEENIEQLMDDICSGVFDLLDGEDKIHFMETIILVMENDVANNIKPQDHKALPSRIDNVIDGQQRISTIALLGCCLYQNIYEIKEKLPASSDLYDIEGLKEAAETYLANLQELFSFDLMRGQPRRKPIIIRGSLDGWTLNGLEDKHYKSDVSSYLANFIKKINSSEPDIQFPEARKKSLVADNIKLIKEWLDKVQNAHVSNHDDCDYPSAWDIGNKQWIEKWIYYCHLAEADPDKINSLSQDARNHGINLNLFGYIPRPLGRNNSRGLPRGFIPLIDSTIKLLTEAPHAHHIKPIIEIGAKGSWDKALVEKRTKRICEILWERMY